MKKIKHIILIVSCLLICVSCAKGNEEIIQDDIKQDDVVTKDNDPLSLSFKSDEYFTSSQLKNRLSNSVLEYCSYVLDVEDSDIKNIFTWNLKSNNKEVYRCEYSYNKKSTVSCKVSEGYEDYLNGDTALIRHYTMPYPNDHTEMFIYLYPSDYYDEHFILGKYSDMTCYIYGDDIYLEYYWYQDTGDDYELVYKSTATNYETTSGMKYNMDIWLKYEESISNINIIPYDDFPRDSDYRNVVKEWKNLKTLKNIEEREKENKDKYCLCLSSEQLYDEYFEYFEDYLDAVDYYEANCN